MEEVDVILRKDLQMPSASGTIIPHQWNPVPFMRQMYGHLLWIRPAWSYFKSDIGRQPDCLIGTDSIHVH